MVSSEVPDERTYGHCGYYKIVILYTRLQNLQVFIHELDGKINQLYLKQCLTSFLLIYSGMYFHVDAKINLKIPCIISKYECFYYDCTF